MSPRDSRDANEATQRTRRRFLAAAGAAGLVGVAGCSGNGGEDGPDGEVTSTDDPGRESTDTVADAGGGTTSGAPTDTAAGDVCPSTPLSYRQYEIAATGESDPVVSVEAPEGQPFSVGPNRNRRWEVSFGEDRITVVPMRNRIDDVEAFASADGVTDVTEEYDVPDGWRVVVRRAADDIPTNVHVGIPISGGALLVRVSNTGVFGCPDVVVTVQDRIINSMTLL